MPMPFAFEALEIYVGEREVEDGRLTGLLHTQARIGLSDKTSVRPDARPVRIWLDAHRQERRAQASPVARAATVTEGIATPPPWRKSESTMAMRSSIPTKAPLMYLRASHTGMTSAASS